MEEQKEVFKNRDIYGIAADFNCTGECDFCEQFFQCKQERKWDILKQRRMSRVTATMSKIKYKIAVIGGKGGVGKSLFSANLAMALAMKGRKVAILDQDFDGPCQNKMFGVNHLKITLDDNGYISPLVGAGGVGVISLGSVVASDSVVTWYHEKRRGATEEFLSHVNYGDLDYLVIDLPPGTSSDALNMMQYIPELTGIVAVTIPAKVSQLVVRKATILALDAGYPVLGIVENMSGHVCAHCGKVYEIFCSGAGEQLAEELNIPLLGKIPIDSRLSKASDEGKPFVSSYPDSPATKVTLQIVDNIVAVIEKDKVKAE